MRERLLAKGWQTKVELLNAADYGVPQRRVRLFLLGYRTGKAPSWPLPTHLQQPDLTSKKSWVSLGSAVGSLDISDDELIRPTGKLAIELADLPAGTGVKSAGKKETTRPGGHWGYRQGSFIADLSLPARTVTANSQQDWIRDPKLGLRKLCPRECAAVQAFPGNWEFSGERADQYRLIGNAVPPQLARALGNGLADFIKSMPIVRRRFSEQELEPLPSRLDLAIRYTKREELRNGESRRASARTPQMIKRQRIA
jgi:DNA (cytosine-5)-methyltransferase 1